MTQITKTRESLELSPAEWAALETLAAATGSLAARGPNAKQPSWRALIQRIAAGELTVVSPEATL